MLVDEQLQVNLEKTLPPTADVSLEAALLPEEFWPPTLQEVLQEPLLLSADQQLQH